MIASSRRKAFIAAGSLLATGIVLAAAFFPLLFNRWLPRDDEGVFQFGLRELLADHGHIYSTIWSDLYGPFYYLFMSTVYRVIHQQPTPENGRWIVLTLTVASAMLFGAAVWRVTKSLPASLLAEVAAFLILIPAAGGEPMHPGSLEVLLVGAVAFALASYAATQRTAHLAVVGVAVGALLMTKVNAGGLVAVAVVFGLLVGNKRTPRWLQITVGVLTVLVPIGLVSQNISETWAATFALIVVGSLVGMSILMAIDPLALGRWSLVPIAIGATAAVVCSLAFPLITGTPVADVIDGVFIRPLSFSSEFAIPAPAALDWWSLVITVVAICVAVLFSSSAHEWIRTQAAWTHATLAVLALWVLGLGVVTFGQWLPVLVMLPAVAFCCNSPEPIRLALRLLVPLAALQILVAYPVAGSQIAWGAVAVVVPCAIALAAGIDFSRAWREAGVLMRAGATIVACVALVLAMSVLPTTSWKTYGDSPRLGLPGTGPMRIDPAVAASLQEVTKQLRTHCDTFYGVPNLNSFFVFTGLPAVTGMVANGGPAGLTDEQKLQVRDALLAESSANKRVCILRDGSVAALEPGPLTDVLNQYGKVVATVASYTIATRN